MVKPSSSRALVSAGPPGAFQSGEIAARGGRSGADEVVTVDRAGLERLTARGRVVDGAEDDLVDLSALAPVVVVRLQRDLLAGGPLLELVRAGAHRVAHGVLGQLRGLGGSADLVGAELLHGRGALHAEGRQGQRGDEAGERLVELDRDRVLAIRRAGLVDRVRGVGRVALEELVVVVAERLGCGETGPVVPAVEVRADGLGVERRAVVERHALLEREGVGHAVLGRLPALGEQRGGVGGAGLGADEALEDLTRDAEALAVLREGGVEARRIGGRGEDERAVDVAGSLGTLVAALARDAAREGESGDRRTREGGEAASSEW